MQQGFFSIQQTCPACKGAGTTIADPCNDCHGRGRVRKTRTLAVKVPAGVDDGDRIRLSGEGEAGRNGGPAGDLYVEIRVSPHKIFERDGSNLSCEVPVSIATATLGGEVELPTLDGNVALKIPAAHSPARCSGCAAKASEPCAMRGRVTCSPQVAVETPVHLTAEQRDLLEKFDASLQSGGEKHSPRAGGWLDYGQAFLRAH